MIRAATVHVWADGGQGWRQGTWLTAVLWVVSLGVHLGYDYLIDGKGAQAGLGSASLLLYFGVTFTIQRLILQARAQRIDQGSSTGPTPGIACARASASRAAAACWAFSPVRDMRDAIRPVTIGLEKEVPLHRAMPWNVLFSPA